MIKQGVIGPTRWDEALRFKDARDEEVVVGIVIFSDACSKYF